MLNLEDREKVREIYALYAQTIDEDRFEQWVGLFTPQGVFDSPVLGRHAGRDALRTMAENLAKSVDGIQRHLMSNVRFTLEGDRGEGSCNLAYYITRNGNTQLAAVGAYRDKLRKIGDQWYFEERVVSLDTKLSLPQQR